MRDILRGTVWRLAIFTVVGALELFVAPMVFAELRFQKEATHKGEFGAVARAGHLWLVNVFAVTRAAPEPPVFHGLPR